MLPTPHVEQLRYEMVAFTSATEVPEGGSITGACMSSRAEEVAQKAREAFPVLPDVVGGQMSRFKFIHENRWALFDPAGTGTIDAKTYGDYAWSIMLSYAPAGKCVLYLDDYLAMLVGSPKVVASQELNAPWFAKADRANFHMLDRGNKGYITRDDMTSTFDHDFKNLDKEHDGKLSRQEFQ